MLESSYLPETLDREDNQFFCDACNCKVPLATRTFAFTQLPKTQLFITICRFYYDRGTKQKEKVCKAVLIPPALTLAGVTFRLKGAIVHAGRSTNAGHYYSIVQTGSGKWVLCNDASVSVLG